MPAFAGFPSGTLEFLEELAVNNERAWFEANKDRYERLVREPALDFITAMAEPLGKLSGNFLAVPRKVGGSLMRVHKDTRFARDKTPYKTNIGIQFRHVLGKDVHAPGYYVHIEPRECFVGVGLWHPEADALAAIRARIATQTVQWRKVKDFKAFADMFELGGESLRRPPKGYPADTPCMEDIRRKDFIAGCDISAGAIHDRNFVQDVAGRFRVASPFMRFLCDAVNVPF